jgi:U4/U6.U5 tri-snRNP-associated protein 2
LGGTRKRDSSIIYKTFQGEIEITTQQLDKQRGSSGDLMMGEGEQTGVDVKQVPFLFLTLDLPVVPLFADEFEGSTVIPQVPLGQLLRKFNGKTSHVIITQHLCYIN